MSVLPRIVLCNFTMCWEGPSQWKIARQSAEQNSATIDNPSLFRSLSCSSMDSSALPPEMRTPGGVHRSLLCIQWLQIGVPRKSEMSCRNKTQWNPLRDVTGLEVIQNQPLFSIRNSDEDYVIFVEVMKPLSLLPPQLRWKINVNHIFYTPWPPLIPNETLF